jgi:hypothetical protein
MAELNRHERYDRDQLLEFADDLDACEECGGTGGVEAVNAPAGCLASCPECGDPTGERGWLL